VATSKYLGQEVEKGLEVVPRQRIAEECDLLVDDHLEEPVGVEPGQIESI
jgi:hypothetical protein